MSAVITDLPSASDPATFSAKAFAAWEQLAAASADWNLLSVNLDSAVDAVTAGLAADKWLSGTSYVTGDLRFSPAAGLLYRRTTNGAGTTDPAADTANWTLQTTSAPTLVVVSGTTQTGVKSVHYEMTNAAACTFTLPLSPAVGDWVWIGFTNARVDNVIARNGQNIMGLAEDMTVNWPYAGLILRYISAGFGWRIFK
jgi:hypothetical protein